MQPNACTCSVARLAKVLLSKLYGPGMRLQLPVDCSQNVLPEGAFGRGWQRLERRLRLSVESSPSPVNLAKPLSRRTCRRSQSEAGGQHAAAAKPRAHQLYGGAARCGRSIAAWAAEPCSQDTDILFALGEHDAHEQQVLHRSKVIESSRSCCASWQLLPTSSGSLSMAACSALILQVHS